MINLNLISKHRNLLFGLSIISIILFHFSADVKIAIFDQHLTSLFGEDLNIAQNIIYILITGFYVIIRSVGVEIFLFLSGMGLYWSYQKDTNTIHFYKRRCSRILIPYLITAIPFWITRDFIIENKGLTQFVQDISFISLFTEGTISTWYIGFALLTYLIYPLLYYLLFRTKHRNAIFVVILTASLVLPALTINHISYVANAAVAILRFPIFLIGCRMAPEIKNNRLIKRKYLQYIFAIGLALKLSFGFIYINPYPLRLLSCVWALSLLAIFLIITDAIEKKSKNAIRTKCYNIISTAGNYSLELYLIHVCIRNILKHCGIQTWHILPYCAIIVTTCLLAVPLKNISTKLAQKIFK